MGDAGVWTLIISDNNILMGTRCDTVSSAGDNVWSLSENRNYSHWEWGERDILNVTRHPDWAQSLRDSSPCVHVFTIHTDTCPRSPSYPHHRNVTEKYHEMINEGLHRDTLLLMIFLGHWALIPSHTFAGYKYQLWGINKITNSTWS